MAIAVAPLLVSIVATGVMVIVGGPVVIVDMFRWWQSHSGPWRFYWLGAGLTGASLLRPFTKAMMRWLLEEDWLDRFVIAAYILPLAITAWALASFLWPVVAWGYSSHLLARRRGIDDGTIDDERANRRLLEQIRAEAGR